MQNYDLFSVCVIKFTRPQKSRARTENHYKVLKISGKWKNSHARRKIKFGMLSPALWFFFTPCIIGPRWRENQTAASL